MDELLLIGGGGHCKAVIDVVERTGRWRIVGIVERSESGLLSVCGYPVVGCDDDLEMLYRPGRAALVTVGQIKSSAIRRRLFERARNSGFALPAVVSPSASLARTARIGPGSVIMNFAHVGPDACVGDNVIINTRALVEHDVSIGCHCHVSTGALVNGGVRVGNDVFIGSGAICREGISVGTKCVIGMGAVVRKSLPDHAVAY